MKEKLRKEALDGVEQKYVVSVRDSMVSIESRTREKCVHEHFLSAENLGG